MLSCDCRCESTKMYKWHMSFKYCFLNLNKPTVHITFFRNLTHRLKNLVWLIGACTLIRLNIIVVLQLEHACGWLTNAIQGEFQPSRHVFYSSKNSAGTQKHG